jgi:hypothetical protein
MLMLECGIGAARVWARQEHTDLDLSGSFGGYVTNWWAISLRGHVDVSKGPETMTTIGLDVRRWLGLGPWNADARRVWFLAAGPSIAHVRGTGGLDAIAFAVEARAGILFGHVQIAAEAMPMYAFANSGLTPDATLGAAVHVGLAISAVY